MGRRELSFVGWGLLEEGAAALGLAKETADGEGPAGGGVAAGGEELRFVNEKRHRGL